MSQVDSDSSANVGRSHGSSGDGVGGGVRSDPGSSDINSGSEDINTGSVVGEVGTGISIIGGSDSDGSSDTSGGIVASVGSAVSGGDDVTDSSNNGLLNGLIEGSGGSSSQRHVGNRLGVGSTASVVLGYEINSSNNSSPCSGSVGVQYLFKMLLQLSLIASNVLVLVVSTLTATRVTFLATP